MFAFIAWLMFCTIYGRFIFWSSKYGKQCWTILICVAVRKKIDASGNALFPARATHGKIQKLYMESTYWFLCLIYISFIWKVRIDLYGWLILYFIWKRRDWFLWMIDFVFYLESTNQRNDVRTAPLGVEILIILLPVYVPTKYKTY